MSRSASRHGVFVSLFGLLIVVVPGVFAVTVALFHNVLPPPFGPPRLAGLSEAVETLRLLMIGVGRLVLGWGLLSFSRWAWYAYVAWTAVTIYGLSQTMFAGEAVITLERYSIFVPLGLPYLWLKRRHFGIGARSRRPVEV